VEGVHDLGGKQGFGRVRYPSAPHDEKWRPLVRALLAFAVESRICNMDEFRHAIERMAPRHYISAPYFERHLTAIAVAVDIFRVENGKIAEHWDVMQEEVPADQTANGNSMILRAQA